MKNIYLLRNKGGLTTNKCFTGLAIFTALVFSSFISKAQIYQHNFGTSTISAYPYTVSPTSTPVPGILNANLSGSTWTNTMNPSPAWTSFAGSSGQAISLNNSGQLPNPTITLSLNIAPGYQASVTSFSFWRRQSGTGATNWSMTINGISVGAGTVPTTGAGTGTLTVANAVTNQTGALTVVISLSGASGTGTFRLDDFTLNGTVVPSPTLTASPLTGFGNVCTGTTPGSNTFTITGTVLTAANVTVGALTGYTFSTDNATFFPSLSMPQPGGAFSRTIYVRFSPVLVQPYNGNIPIGGGGAPAITVAASGSGVNTAPTITDGTVSNVTTNSADINATISPTGCTAVSTYGVEYSTTAGFANGAGTAVAGGVLSAGNFTANLLGLTPPGQTFYFHTYATNSGGTTYGAEGSFTLINTTPVLNVPPTGAGSLDPFGNVCINTAATNTFNLSGSVLNGSNITIGPLSNFTFSIAAGGPFTASITLVNGGVGYSYSGGVLSATIYTRFIPTAVTSYNGNIPVSGGGATSINVAASGDGVNTAPAVTTGAAIFVTTNSATLPGTIDDPGCGVTLDYGIEYSNAPFTPGAGTAISGSNLTAGNFSVALTLLTPNTTYYYCAYATNAAGTTYGTVLSFTTFSVPTKLVILPGSVNPASPTALSPFSVTVQAQDNAGNPVDVTVDTDIQFAQVSGSGIFTFPNSNLPAATIPAGINTIIIDDLSYDQVENNVSISASASSGMSLTTSIPIVFNVIAYTGPSTFIWGANGSSSWFVPTGDPEHWLNGVTMLPSPTPPGATTGVNNHLALFTSQASLVATGGLGINFTNVGVDYSVGAVVFNQTYATSHSGNVISMGNSSGSVTGTLNLYGVNFSNLGGIAGNNYTSLLLGNYMSSATTKTFQVVNSVGGTQNLTLNLAVAGSIVAGAGRFININTLLTGNQPLQFTGGGTLEFAPSGAASVNTFSGAITVSNGTLVTGNPGAFSTVAPNAITLGSGTNGGILRLNGNSVTIGGLNTAGTAGNANKVDNGNASATLTINNSLANNFAGSFQNGSSGILTLIKNGAGNLTLTGQSSFTGLTTINNGRIILNRTGGDTYLPGNSITVNGAGVLQVSKNQVIKDLTLATGGTLIVDAGVSLTITGNYNPLTCTIINNGTIIMQGSTPQSFPGVFATVSAMNNLSINDPFGVSLNKSLNIAGTLNLAAIGTFTVGAFTLTLNNPITGTVSNFSANNTSSIVIAGTAASVNIPSVVTQLKNLTVSNSSGTTLQGNLNIATAFTVTNTAGTVDAGTYTFNGTANVNMTGGNLLLSKNTAILPEFSGAYSLTGGTVTFNGVGVATDAQTVRPINYFNFTSSSTGDRILSSSGVTGVSNVFTPFTNAYTVINSTVDFNKIGAQNIPAFAFYNLTLSGGAFTKTLVGNIDIQGMLSLATNTKLNLANLKATLKSTAINTANVDKINTVNSFIYGASGGFVVERFLETGPTAPNHGKSWQLLSTPTSGQSLNGAWQEGNIPLGTLPAGYGTILTSEKPGAVARGFDFYTPAGGPSIKTYNVALNQWDGIDNGSTPTTAIPIANKKGYMIFVRGDRFIQSAATPANTTTLRTTGKLYAPGTDAPPSSIVLAAKLESVGNPYASAIDFISLLSSSSGIDTKYYVWDPLLPSFYGYGGYQTISSSNGYKPSPGGTANYSNAVAYTKIQSGQAFFVYSTPGGTVSFTENNKISGSQNVFRPAPTPGRQYLRAYLYAGTGSLADGNVAAFDPSFNNSFGPEDAIKIDNFGENFGITSNEKILAIEARGRVGIRDTIFYNLKNLRTQNYQIKFAPENMGQAGLSAFLVDRFMDTKTAVSLSDSTIVNINITADPASQVPGRLYMVFSRGKPISTINMSATRNSDDIMVTWQVMNEENIVRYELERGINAKKLEIIKTIEAGTEKIFNPVYHYNDYEPLDGANFYRIIAVSAGDQVLYSPIVRVESKKELPGIQVIPNPVINRTIRFKLNDFAAGIYGVKLINRSGQVVYANTITINDKSGFKSIVIGNEILSGAYQLVLSGLKSTFSSQIIIK